MSPGEKNRRVPVVGHLGNLPDDVDLLYDDFIGIHRGYDPSPDPPAGPKYFPSLAHDVERFVDGLHGPRIFQDHVDADPLG